MNRLLVANRWVILVAAILFPIAANASQTNQEQSSSNLFAERQELDKQLLSSIDELVAWCHVNHMPQAEPVLRKYCIQRYGDRQYIFIAPENRVDENGTPDGWPEELKSRTQSVLNKHAAELFNLAKRSVTAGHGSWAIQLLNESLFFNPNFETVRKILGHRQIESDGAMFWRVSKDRLRTKPSRKQHSEFDWPEKNWLITSTPHFQIESRATKEQTELLAGKLDRWHAVWRQVFFDYYNRAINVQRWIDGKSAQRPTTRKFKVVFFADRDEYLAKLSPIIPGIEVSTGYYNDQQKTSYFFFSQDPTIQDTWRHELTHQLFQESRQSVKSPFGDQFLWLGEGIAMYFESLVDRGAYVTLGGFDARRLQYARLRRLKEQFRFPLEKLSKLDQKQFQAQDDVAKIYSQSAGITQFLMAGDNGSMQQSLVEFLQLAYRGKLKTDTFEKVIGKSFDQIESEYEKFLKVEPEQLTTLSAPRQQTELALIGTRLQDDSLAAVGECTNLQWLDLSGCDVRGERMKHLEPCSKLQQLFLTGARVDDIAVGILTKLPIKELDLSGSNLNNDQLTTLIGSKKLKVLNVAGTRVTSHGIKTVSSSRPDIELVSNFNNNE